MKFFGKELLFNGNKVYHTGNKPTASEIGAAAKESGFKSSYLTGHYIDNYRQVTKGDTNTNSYLSLLRANQAELWRAPQYGSGLAWGMEDTHGYFYTNYSTPQAYIGSGNGNKLNWIEEVAFVGHEHTKPETGNWWNEGYVKVGTDGVSEVGKYIDFHNSPNSGDYSIRLIAGGDNGNELYLPTVSGQLALTSELSNYLPLWGGTMTGKMIVDYLAPKSTSQIMIITNKDGNNSGDGNTHLGYNTGNGYSHYFRGTGTVHIDTSGGLNVARNCISLAGVPLSIGSSAPSIGGVWIQI